MTDLLLVGHPFAPIGRGEDLRTCFRALRSARLQPRILDVFGSRSRHHDPELESELAGALTENGAAGTRIFFLNGDELDTARRTMGDGPSPGGRDIVYPVWELSRYPEEWAKRLDTFDEIWVPSQFVAEAVRPAVRRPVTLLPWPIEPVPGLLRGRRDFGVPESAYAFLFLFDLRSYLARKNPEAALEAFRRVVERRPASPAVLVLKVAGAETNPGALDELREITAPFGPRVVLLDRPATDSETKGLIRCCDAFLSLHRSEGFGRGLAEAMAFGRPVIATGYSGNLQFMNEGNSCLVGYDLVPVPPDAYPCWLGQVWAEPRVDDAVAWMIRLLDDEPFARAIGRAGRRTVECELSYLACGFRMRDRLDAMATRREPAPELPQTA